MNKNSSGTVYSGTDVYMQMCVQRFIYADVCTVIYISHNLLFVYSLEISMVGYVRMCK